MADYEEKRNRSVYIEDIERVNRAMNSIIQALSDTYIRDGSIVVTGAWADDILAEIWWDSEGEVWLCDWQVL